jgi:hypothetical protein
MIDVVNDNKRCLCGKARANFNKPNEKKAVYCNSCKSDDMINVNSRKCQCGKANPTYNEPNKRTPICCLFCKTVSMIDVMHKKCQCGKARALFNKLGEKTAMYCAKCKTNEMIDLENYNKRCTGNIQYGCPYNQRGNRKYKNYCSQCFRREFPLDPLTFQIRSKTKEIAVRDYINSTFDGFYHDKPLETSHCDCTIRRRIDHRKLINNTLLAIETDENQHKSYDVMDEQIRYDDLFMAHSGKWIYIRLNPDKYKDKQGKSKNPTLSTRLAVLKIEIEKQINRIEKEENAELIERIYLYYDGYD